MDPARDGHAVKVGCESDWCGCQSCNGAGRPAHAHRDAPGSGVEIVVQDQNRIRARDVHRAPDSLHSPAIWPAHPQIGGTAARDVQWPPGGCYVHLLDQRAAAGVERYGPGPANIIRISAAAAVYEDIRRVVSEILNPSGT